jgi:hypothetical protein
VKQFDVQVLQTELADTYPEGQVVLQVLSGFNEKEVMQERQ